MSKWSLVVGTVFPLTNTTSHGVGLFAYRRTKLGASNMQGIGSRIIVLKFITTANDKLENELSSIADRGQTDRVTTLLTLSLSILIYDLDF